MHLTRWLFVAALLATLPATACSKQSRPIAACRNSALALRYDGISTDATGTRVTARTVLTNVSRTPCLLPQAPTAEITNLDVDPSAVSNHYDFRLGSVLPAGAGVTVPVTWSLAGGRSPCFQNHGDPMTSIRLSVNAHQPALVLKASSIPDKFRFHCWIDTDTFGPGPRA